MTETETTPKNDEPNKGDNATGETRKKRGVKNIGFDSIDDDFSNVENKRLNYQDSEVAVRISSDIFGGVHDGKYANDGTEDAETDVRKNSSVDGCDETARLR